MKQKFFAKFFYLTLVIYFLGFASFQPGVKVIFKNATEEDLKELKVNIKGKEFSFINLKSRGKTKPITVAGSYSYCYAQAITLKDTVTFQPIDYVGEKLYTSGTLIMNLVIIGEGKDRFLTFR